MTANVERKTQSREFCVSYEKKIRGKLFDFRIRRKYGLKICFGVIAHFRKKLSAFRCRIIL